MYPAQLRQGAKLPMPIPTPAVFLTPAPQGRWNQPVSILSLSQTPFGAKPGAGPPLLAGCFSLFCCAVEINSKSDVT
jgi:hypothetical protein